MRAPIQAPLSAAPPAPAARAARRARAPQRSHASDAAALAGGALGGYFGQPALGAAAGRAVSKFLGFGDYELVTNSLIPEARSAGPNGPPVPIFDRQGRRGVRVTEREYIGDVFSGTVVNGASVFTSTAYPLNPAQPATFPWFANLATQFEQWEPNGIVFEFISTSSEFNGTSQALGTVILGTDYDPLAPAPANKIFLENLDYSDSCKASCSMVHGIECAPLERGDRLLLTRPTPIPSGTDNLRFYDLGNLFVATQGCSVGNVNLGELWVTYDITLYKKQLSTNALGTNINTFFRSAASTSSLIFGDASNSWSLGNMPFQRTGNNFTFPANVASGVYLLTIFLDGSSSAGVTVSAIANCSIDHTNGDPDNYWPSPIPYDTPWPFRIVDSTGFTGAAYLVNINGPGATIGFSATIIAAVASFTITQLPSASPLVQLPF